MSNIVLQQKKQDVYNQVMRFLDRKVNRSPNGLICTYHPSVHNNAVNRFADTGAFPFLILTRYDLAIFYGEYREIPHWAKAADDDDRWRNTIVVHREIRMESLAKNDASLGPLHPMAEIHADEYWYKQYYDIGIPFEFVLSQSRATDESALATMIRNQAWTATIDFLEADMQDGEIAKFEIPFWDGFKSQGLGVDN